MKRGMTGSLKKIYLTSQFNSRSTADGSSVLIGLFRGLVSYKINLVGDNKIKFVGKSKKTFWQEGLFLPSKSKFAEFIHGS